MRSGVVAGGILLILIGIGLAAAVSMGEVESGTQVTGGGGTEGGGGFVTADLFMVIGGILAIIGFIVLIAGLAASPSKEQPSQQVTVQASKAEEKEPTKTETLAICPECKGRIPADTKFCPECGADLRKKETEETEEEPEEASEESESETSPAFCMYCGTEIPPGSEYCPECGKKVR